MQRRIVVDIDDVIIDLMPVWLDEYNRLGGERLDYNSLTTWDMSKRVRDPKLLYSILDTPIWRDCKPVRGAGTAAYKMLRAGIDVIYVTAQFEQSKLDWMLEHGYIESRHPLDRRFIVCSDKSLIDADMIIDDKAETVVRYPNGGIIFARPWNDIKLWPVNVERIGSWPEIIQYLGI